MSNFLSTSITSGTAIRLRTPYVNVCMTATTSIGATAAGALYFTGPLN